MEEHEPEEGAEEAPLENQIEPAEEPQAPEVDSTRAEAAEMPVADAEEVHLEHQIERAAEPQAPEVDSMPAEPAEVPMAAAEEAPQAAVESGGGAGAIDAELEEPMEGPEETAVVEVAEAAEEPRPARSVPSGARAGRLPLQEAAPEASSEPAWYVIHCYSGYENKVRHNLEQRIETMGMKDRIFDVVIPTQEEIEVRDGKRRTVERHIFPGYVLVNMSLSEESWYVVRNTPGVTGFVGMGNLPTALRPEEVSQIVKRMEAEAPTVKVSFKVGERVRIIDGPFNDFRGTVADIDLERTKVRVMVSFFGRETPVELDFLQVEKA